MSSRRCSTPLTRARTPTPRPAHRVDDPEAPDLPADRPGYMPRHPAGRWRSCRLAGLCRSWSSPVVPDGSSPAPEAARRERVASSSTIGFGLVACVGDRDQPRPGLPLPADHRQAPPQDQGGAQRWQPSAAPARSSLLRGFVVGLLDNIPIIGPLVSLVDPLLIFRDDQRCLHDHIADTIVVRA